MPPYAKVSPNEQTTVGTMPLQRTEGAIRRSKTAVIKITKFCNIDPEPICMLTADKCKTQSKTILIIEVTNTAVFFLSNHGQIQNVRFPGRSSEELERLDDLTTNTLMNSL
ncbi:MAG: hypothetical protein M3297_03210 [Thermoproteota archaeon]|nr:hypothetical protein [Thermoproteota archaeon]